MRIVGLLFALGGWLIAMSGLFMTTSNMGRGLFACVGIIVSIAGSLGFINKFYQAQAIWKK